MKKKNLKQNQKHSEMRWENLAWGGEWKEISLEMKTELEEM